jgi:hypothetical protein
MKAHLFSNLWNIVNSMIALTALLMTLYFQFSDISKFGYEIRSISFLDFETSSSDVIVFDINAFNSGKRPTSIVEIEASLISGETSYTLKLVNQYMKQEIPIPLTLGPGETKQIKLLYGVFADGGNITKKLIETDHKLNLLFKDVDSKVYHLEESNYEYVIYDQDAIKTLFK